MEQKQQKNKEKARFDEFLSCLGNGKTEVEYEIDEDEFV